MRISAHGSFKLPAAPHLDQPKSIPHTHTHPQDQIQTITIGKEEFAVHLPHLIELSQVQKTQIDEKGTLILKEYKPIYKVINNELVLTGAEVKATCTYRVVSAIGEIEPGHVVTYIRNKDNSITMHSSDAVSHNMPESVWKKATILQVECVEKAISYYDR